MAPEAAVPLFTAAFVSITAVHFSLFFGFLLVAPVMPLFMARFTDHEGVIGAAVGAFTVAAVVVRAFAGGWLDRTGRRRPLLMALSGFALISGAYTWASGVAAVFLLRVLHGAFFGVASTATSTMAADVIPARRRAEGMGYFGSAVSVAQAVAPVFGFSMALSWGFPTLFGVGALLAAAALVVALILARDAGDADPQPLPPLPVGGSQPVAGLGRLVEPAAVVPSGLMLLNSVAFGAVFVLVPLYSPTVGLVNAGIFFSLMAVSVLLVRVVTGRTIDRTDAPGPLLVAMVALAAGLVLIGGGPRLFTVLDLPGGLLLGAALCGITLGIITPTLQAVAVARAPAARRGAANGTFLIALDLGIGIGSMVLGMLANTVGLAPTYLYAVILPLLGLLYIARHRRNLSLYPDGGTPPQSPVRPHPAPEGVGTEAGGGL